jgi:simple sugar transport system permease protein
VPIRHTLALLGIVVVVCVSIGAANPAFLSIGNVFDLVKSSVTLGILAVGLLVVLVSGGIDVSFPAIAAACMYVTCTLALRAAWLDHMVLLLAIAMTLGMALGCANAALISFFRLPALIVTLATASVIRGAVLEFVGTRNITNLPSAMIAFSRLSLWDRPTPGGDASGLTFSLAFLIAAAVLTAAILRGTVVGRGIYALGADASAAERVGFNLRRIHFVVYGLMGGLAGMAGLIHASTIRNANPKDLAGLELTVIAAAVIGGASLTGGRGGVAGTLLGVALLVIVTRSLLLVGVPPEWNAVVLGLLIIVSTTVTALQSRRHPTEGIR